MTLSFSAAKVTADAETFNQKKICHSLRNLRFRLVHFTLLVRLIRRMEAATDPHRTAAGAQPRPPRRPTAASFRPTRRCGRRARRQRPSRGPSATSTSSIRANVPFVRRHNHLDQRLRTGKSRIEPNQAGWRQRWEGGGPRQQSRGSLGEWVGRASWRPPPPSPPPRSAIHDQSPRPGHYPRARRL